MEARAQSLNKEPMTALSCQKSRRIRRSQENLKQNPAGTGTTWITELPSGSRDWVTDSTDDMGR